MNVLEKILEEIEEATFQEDAPIYVGDTEVDGYVRESVVKEIICSHMDDGKDIPHTCDTCRGMENRPQLLLLPAQRTAGFMGIKGGHT